LTHCIYSADPEWGLTFGEEADKDFCVSHEKASLEEAWTRLKTAGLKRTEPRDAVLRVLAGGHGPFGAEDVFQALKEEKAGTAVDLVTVYRSLQSFAEAGILHAIDLGDQIARYELALDPDHHHHHVTCRKCRKTLPLENCFLEELESRIRREVEAKGFRAIEHRLEFTGVCDRCSSL
jgi:Fur family ferric uptake transcriptional regulator